MLQFFHKYLKFLQMYRPFQNFLNCQTLRWDFWKWPIYGIPFDAFGTRQVLNIKINWSFLFFWNKQQKVIFIYGLIWIVLQKECQQINGKPDPKQNIPAILLNSTAQFCANIPKTVTGMEALIRGLLKCN